MIHIENLVKRYGDPVSYTHLDVYKRQVSTVAPDVMPKKISIIINWICPASEEPDNTFSPTLPSIITSTAVTPTLIRFWSAIGIIKANTFL